MPRASQVDFLVMGAGVAGLRAAVELARHGEVLVVTKESLSESNTHYAQGGIAVAMEGDEDIALHLQDTINAGDGIVYRPAAEALVSEGPIRVAELIEWGTNFDRESGELLRTREGAHSLPRILHSSGDAAWLRNDRGERFMERYHPLLELAPRDVVARAIAREGLSEQGTARPVYLDMRHVRGINLHERFPGISAFLAPYSLDLARDLIPVRPAAHYLMGGIKTDLAGRTSLGGLYAAGEAACTGVHGANRLASNSLLEGLVFGVRAAQSMIADGLTFVPVDAPEAQPVPLSAAEAAQVEDLITQLQVDLWAYAGLLREEPTLRQGLAAQAACAAALKELTQQGKTSRRLAEAQAVARVAHAILHSALARTESRGAHFRNDHPTRDDQNFQMHSVLTLSLIH